jgi:hypothetical protein
MNQPPPGSYPAQPAPVEPQRSAGPNTALVVALVVVAMTLIFVVVFFLFLQESDNGPEAATTATAPSAAVASTIVAPASATVPAQTAPPTTALVLAPCVNGDVNRFTTGRRGEIALYQTTLKNLGFDPGEIDGYFGSATQAAASAEFGANGDMSEIFPDDASFLPALFQRLGIACP